MATNDFQPFATGASANVTNQADWLTLPALSSGFQSGKASSAQVNKALRQATTVGALIGQFIANANLDALDDGDITTLLNNFITAITTNIGLTNARFITSRGSNINGTWSIWSDGAIDIGGPALTQVGEGLVSITYPIQLPEATRNIAISEHISNDPGNVNSVHVSMVIDSTVTNLGFSARCQMYDGSISSNGFSYQAYYMPTAS